MFRVRPFQPKGLCYNPYMMLLLRNLKVFVAATILVFGASMTVAQDPRLDTLFERLKNVSAEDAPQIESKIILEWSKSGSAAMDLLLRRARADFEKEDWANALIHLTALTDHAPDFAEGWHAKALAHFNRQEIGLALDALERALALEPRHFQAMGGVMAILEDAGVEDQALEMAYLIKAIHPHFDNLSQAIERLEAKAAGQTL